MTKYKKGFSCYTCGLPQRLYGEHIHGNVATGNCDLDLYHHLKIVCWIVYWRENLREKYLGGDIGGPDDFREWIGDRDEVEEMINGCRLMLNVWRDRE